MTYDVIVRNGLWFDGTGRPAAGPYAGHSRRHSGRTSRPEPLDETDCPDVIDAAGKWIVPGFIDVHTHYDAEVLLDPGLRESVRHGVTTVLLGNCSLSTVYADSEDAADLFSRVEAVPRKFVLGALEAKKTWIDARRIRSGTRRSALGPNVELDAWPFGPTNRGARARARHRPTVCSPTDAELDRMAEKLEKGARRRTPRHVRDGRGHRQARRRPLPVPGIAVDLRDVARAPKADRRAAQAPPDSAERSRRQEPDVGDQVLPLQQRHVRPPCGSADEPAGVGRRQVGTRRRAGLRTRAPGCSTGCWTPSCGSSTFRCRSSCTPTESICRSSRSSVQAPRPCISEISWSATSFSPTPNTAAVSDASSTAISSDRPCGTATFTTPPSSSAPTRA